MWNNSSIIILLIIGIYIKNNFTFKQLIIDGMKYVLLVFVGISMAGILLLSAAYILLQGRGESTSAISLIQLFTIIHKYKFCHW